MTATASIHKAPGVLLKGLQQIVGKAHVLNSEETLRPFECDGLSVYRQLPMVAVLPANTREVQQVLKLCQQLQVPVVTRGAGTGLSAGALPHEKGVLLVLSRLNRILEVDTQNQYATVEPGVRNLALSEAAGKHGLFYAPDPSSQIACSIGGNVAENAGGMHCLKYGLTVHNIVGLRGFTVSGEEVTLGGGFEQHGFNLQALLIGSEGMLAVVTEITVRLLPKPAEKKTLLAAFNSVEGAGQAVGNIIAAGIIPAALEMMDNTALCAAEDFAGAGYPRGAAAILLVELDGSAENVEEQGAVVRQVLQRGDLSELKEAANEQESRLMWQGRKSAFPAVGRIARDYYCMDGTIPRSSLATVLGYIKALSEEYGFAVANVFHAGDGNLHPLILFDANIPGQLEQVETMGARILEKCIEVGGTITGEHGVGVEKIRQMPLQFNDHELGLFHNIKQVFDPGTLLNPGKNIPLLKHCQEYRALANRTSAITPAAKVRQQQEEPGVTIMRECLLDARNEHRLLCIDGNQSKGFLGLPLEGEVLSSRHHTGILYYDSDELVITARTGTPLAEIEATLAEKGQMLACEPPHFGQATLGGMLGAGFAGPRRPYTGSVADQLLGVRLMDGRGQLLSFGGRVMKNVAGYDVSRFLVGSMGCLGMITEATLKVLPKPAAECSFRVAVDAGKVCQLVNQMRLKGFPVSASCHDGEQLVVRFSAGQNEIASLKERLQQAFSSLEMEAAESNTFWLDIKEHRHEFFKQPKTLWRISVAANTPPLLLQGKQLTEWHGALRWLATDGSKDDEVFSRVAELGGSAVMFRPGAYAGSEENEQSRRFQPLSPVLLDWHKQLKAVFDPEKMLNLGRMHPEF